MLAYYLYFLADDERAVKSAWNYLLKTYNLETEAGMVVETDFVPSAFPLTLLRSAKGDASAYQYMVRNVSVIVAIFPFDVQKANEEVGKMKAELQEALAESLGEGTVLVGSGRGDALMEDLKTRFPQSPLCRTDLKEGTLYKLEKHNIYGFLPLGEQEYEFLRRFLPLIDLALHKLEREKGFFQERIGLITEHRKEVDSKVSSILSKQLSSKNVLGPETLEGIIEELSSMYGRLTLHASALKSHHSSFLSELKNLKARVEKVVDRDGEENCLGTYVMVYTQFADRLKQESDSIRLTLESIKEAIDVVQTKIALRRSKETQGLMEEGISLQVAAGFIEFIIVFYYTLSSWKILAPEAIHYTPSYIIFTVVFGLATAVAAFTHFLAVCFRKKKRFGPWAGLSLGVVLVFVAIMVYLSINPSAS
jgi:hypothetical protein